MKGTGINEIGLNGFYGNNDKKQLKDYNMNYANENKDKKLNQV